MNKIIRMPRPWEWALYVVLFLVPLVIHFPTAPDPANRPPEVIRFESDYLRLWNEFVTLTDKPPAETRAKLRNLENPALREKILRQDHQLRARTLKILNDQLAKLDPPESHRLLVKQTLDLITLARQHETLNSRETASNQVIKRQLEAEMRLYVQLLTTAASIQLRLPHPADPPPRPSPLPV